MEDISFDFHGSTRSADRNPGISIVTNISIVTPDRNPSLMKVRVEARLLGGIPDEHEEDGRALLRLLAERLRGELP